MKCECRNHCDCDCKDEATTEVQYLDGPRMLCDRCTAWSKIEAEFWEPIDREIIARLRELSMPP